MGKKFVELELAIQTLEEERVHGKIFLFLSLSLSMYIAILAVCHIPSSMCIYL